MTHEESLKLLDATCDFVDSMTDDEFFDYMMKNSPTLRKEIARIDFDLSQTYSDFKHSEVSFDSTTFFIPQDFSSISTNTEKIFKRTEEVEAFEWQMITEAA